MKLQAKTRLMADLSTGDLKAIDAKLCSLFKKVWSNVQKQQSSRNLSFFASELEDVYRKIMKHLKSTVKGLENGDIDVDYGSHDIYGKMDMANSYSDSVFMIDIDMEGNFDGSMSITCMVMGKDKTIKMKGDQVKPGALIELLKWANQNWPSPDDMNVNSQEIDPTLVSKLVKKLGLDLPAPTMDADNESATWKLGSKELGAITTLLTKKFGRSVGYSRGVLSWFCKFQKTKWYITIGNVRGLVIKKSNW